MYVIVYVTTSNIEESKKIGREIVEERLAACASIIQNISSIYWWKGTIEESGESLLLLKTKKRDVKKLIKRVKELHSYENPEIVAVPIKEGSMEYLEWIKNETI